ncbi:hypothetical protein MycrhN_2796 [Mycolicibacterium rhodesiae NBB3]|uniref:Uncharacterized protein n=1 Tax=Mycolicibacterium rhodesiae (strain NBB3) TaxID=710685 RepID=G8RI33_MYCRN|nr:hypothetical protein [Mycolicibacterium rhodesiae]AEV73370.1 hypothetical protein MycrhN_2796 [Mycolicibacterium rhodesiae NBB3]
MSTDVKPKPARLVRVARHPVVRAVAKCALMCALSANSGRRTMKDDTKCCG